MYFIILFLLWNFYGNTSALLVLPDTSGLLNLFAGCVVPALECPNVNVTFWLYTRATVDKPEQLLVDDPNSITSASWVPNAPIKVLIHGYTGDKDFAPNAEIRPAYMKCCNYNIISVDYGPIAAENCFLQAAANVELVGMCLAQLINSLVKDHQFKPDLFHIIGFSLGAHVAGYTSNYFNGRFRRITGLDPALPLFVTKDRTKKLDRTDGRFVDCLHTNSLQRGKIETSGHVDFYANGGFNQPGCMATQQQSLSSCNHARAPIYFAESITTKVGFYGSLCFVPKVGQISIPIDWCTFTGSSEVLFGEKVSRSVRGIYFFNTNAQPPYAQGKKFNNFINFLSSFGK